MAQREKRLKELKKQEKRQKKLQQKAAAASASEAAAALANATVALTPAPVPRPVQGNACQKEELQREVASSPGPSDSEQVVRLCTQPPPPALCAFSKVNVAMEQPNKQHFPHFPHNPWLSATQRDKIIILSHLCWGIPRVQSDSGGLEAAGRCVAPSPPCLYEMPLNCGHLLWIMSPRPFTLLCPTGGKAAQDRKCGVVGCFPQPQMVKCFL